MIAFARGILFAASFVFVAYGQDLAIIQRVHDTDKGTDQVYVGLSADHKKRVVAGDKTRAMVILPKPTTGGTEEFEARVQNDTRGMSVTLSREAVYALAVYSAPWTPGERFEPVLSIRGVIVDGKPLESATLELPNELTVALDADKTQFGDYTAVFRIVYAPPFLMTPVDRPVIGQRSSWCATQEDPQKYCAKEKIQSLIENVVFRADASELEFGMRRYTDSLTPQKINFVLLPQEGVVRAEKSNLEATVRVLGADDSLPKTRREELERRFTSRIRELEEILKNVFVETDDQKKTAAKQNLAYVPANRVHRNVRTTATRPIIIPVASPVTSTEYPFYLAANFVRSRANGTSSAYALEINMNPNNDWLQIKKQRFESTWSVWQALSFNGKVTNGDTADDENSLKASWQVEFRHARNAKCAQEDPKKPCDFTRPYFRRISIYSGPRFELSKNAKDKNLVVPVPEVRFFFPRRLKLIAGAELAAEVITGYEIGRTLSSSIKKITDGATPPDGQKPATFSNVVRTDDLISRVHGGALFNVTWQSTGDSKAATLFKRVRLDFSYDYMRLFKEEQFIDQKEYDGTFTPAQPFPPELGFGSAQSKFTLLVPNVRAGSRRYLDTKLSLQLMDGFGVYVGYSRGELAPKFQFVNKIAAGLEIRIGKGAAPAK